jgi:hypothetical protein
MADGVTSGNLSGVSGVSPTPGAFGKQAHRQYVDLTLQAKDTFERTGNRKALKQVAKVPIRYTSSQTVQPNAISREGIQNAVGYAHADIEHSDHDGDHLLTYTTIIQGMGAKAANILASADLDNNQKISLDEWSAKIITEDMPLQLFEMNKTQYRQLMDPESFAKLDAEITKIRRENPDAYALDGQMTGGEREMMDALTSAPIPTNLVMGGVQGAFQVKDIVQAGPDGPGSPSI